ASAGTGSDIVNSINELQCGLSRTGVTYILLLSAYDLNRKAMRQRHKDINTLLLTNRLYH
ncbi:hypothetical protein, partial [uncultured Psychrobacter sp.]|uniref:hypothetical protein n=1 Tax=uncultured Psychrobacter sp. TaxID=259303 RepID=UPI00260DEC86